MQVSSIRRITVPRHSKFKYETAAAAATTTIAAATAAAAAATATVMISQKI